MTNQDSYFQNSINLLIFHILPLDVLVNIANSVPLLVWLPTFIFYFFWCSYMHFMWLQDLKCFVFSLISLHFKIKPI